MKYMAALITSLRAFLIAAVAGSSAAQAQGPADPEESEWSAARNVDTVAAYERYLALYPLGRYAQDAFRCIVELSIDPDAACVPSPGAAIVEEGGATRSIVTRGLAADVY